MKRMVVLGDSIAFGQFSPPHETWVHLLSQVAPMPIDNFSWPGDTTRIALERSLPLVQKDKCDVAYIQYGINDSNAWQTDLGEPRVSRDAFAQNLAEMVSRCRAAGAKRVILASNHQTLIDTLRYDVRTRVIADACGCDYIRQSGKTLDGIHLDASGHRDYYERVRACLGW